MKILPGSILKHFRIIGSLTLAATLMHSQPARSQTGAAPAATVQPTPSPSLQTPDDCPPPAADSTPAAAPAPLPKATLCAIEVQDPLADHEDVALGKFVILKLDQPWATTVKLKETATNKLGLFINDFFMKGLDPTAVPGHPNQIRFQLKRTDDKDNRAAWSFLFGRKSLFGGSKSKDSSERLTLTIGLQDGSWAAQNPQVLYLEYFPDWQSWLVLLLSVVVVGGTIALGAKSSMLSDSGDPRADKRKGTYSLGRFQMALWFVTVVFAFLFDYAVTGDASPIPQGALILMGIGAGTALGSAAIDLNKRTASKTNLLNWTAEKGALPDQIKSLQAKIDAAQPGDTSLAPLHQQLLTTQQQLSTVTTQLDQVKSTEVSPSEGLALDLLSDENGISFHRLQVVGWTLVFWVVFVSALFKSITMVDFDTTQLALMGISGTTYLGFKLQEKQS